MSVKASSRVLLGAGLPGINRLLGRHVAVASIEQGLIERHGTVADPLLHEVSLTLAQTVCAEDSWASAVKATQFSASDSL